MEHKINDDNWNQNEVQGFVAEWGKHIIHSDMRLNAYMQQQQGL
ncbi:hypothetical protein [Bathymodiolus platifrons methanotrophic gill symbiont]|nr:hypothetical protein [Bathymodiolus platifrons methanotrophic gill symbiont]